MRRVELEVQIDGQDLHVVGEDVGDTPQVGFVESCEVGLGVGSAGEFRIVVQAVIEPAKGDSEAIDTSGAWIGKPVRIRYGGSAGSTQFEGTVTEVHLNVDADGADSIVVLGHGPLWALSGGERFRTFTKKSFSAVVKEVLSGHGLSPTDESESKLQYEFLVQHGESDFAFVDRLCREAGEWLFYDGSKVFLGVGESHGGPPVRLEWGKQLHSCRAAAHCAPLQYQAKVYQYEKTTLFEKTSKPPRASGASWFGNAVRASADLFPDPSMSIGGTYAAAKDVDTAVGVRSENSAGATGTIRCKTSRTGVEVGRAVEIAGVGGLSGEFRVVEAEHAYHDHSGYTCTFLAVPSAVRRPQAIALPPEAAVLQVGTVVENNDPDKLGRVRVKLRWHTEWTPWLRVLQLHAGADHGAYVVPEKGDEVLVGFECGDPDRPLVLGSLYHGQAKPQPSAVHATNDHKQFLTRAGNLISVTDTDGQEEIAVSTRDASNRVVLHAGSDPTVVVETKGTIRLKAAKNIELEAGEKVLVKAPKVETTASEHAKVTAGKIEHAAQQEHKISSGSAAKVSATTVEVASSATLKLSAGASADLSASASMALQAPVIRLN